MTAEIAYERRKFDKKMNLANIMQKPKTALTEEGTKAIVERVTLGKSPVFRHHHRDLPSGAEPPAPSRLQLRRLLRQYSVR